MKPPPGSAFCFVHEMAQARAVFRGSNLTRDASVIEGRHVNKKAAGQSDVARDARALFAERLLRDLHDDFLALLQHVGNQLRTARLRAVAMTVSAVALLTVLRTASAVSSRGRDRVHHGEPDSACERENRCERELASAVVAAIRKTAPPRASPPRLLQLPLQPRWRPDVRFPRAERSSPRLPLRLLLPRVRVLLLTPVPPTRPRLLRRRMRWSSAAKLLSCASRAASSLCASATCSARAAASSSERSGAACSSSAKRSSSTGSGSWIS